VNNPSISLRPSMADRAEGGAVPKASLRIGCAQALTAEPRKDLSLIGRDPSSAQLAEAIFVPAHIVLFIGDRRHPVKARM
jgi:hypothetical protein